MTVTSVTALSRECSRIPATLIPVRTKPFGIWGVIVNINGAVQSIGLALLVLFFVAGMVKTCGSFTEVKKPEHALKLFVRFAIAKGAITYGMELMLALFNIVQGTISTIMGSAGFSTPQQTVLPPELITSVEECGFFESIPLLPGFNDLASRFPEIAKEWSERNLPLTPDQVTAFKNIKVWWKCRLGHEWNTLISIRAGGSQCPYCSGIKLLKGFNDLKTKYPSLAAEWSEKNLPLTPDAVNEKSTKNVWWKCRTCGYEWKAVVKARVKGGMCPVCAERAVLQGYNDLGTTDPHLLSEWDYEKNSKWTPSNVSRNSMKVVWWKCGAGHSYRAKITDRTIEQKGCPQCEAEFQQALPQMLIMMYGAQNGITVKSNSDSELGMRLVAYLPELHCAVDIAGATVTEKREQSVKAHICQSNRLGYYLIKRTADASQMAAEIKTLFIRNHIYLHTDSEKDVQVLRERFLEWKYRNACKLNGKY